MPMYDYRCDTCEYEFEEFRHIEDRFDVQCPKCNGPVKQLIAKANNDWFRPHWNENFDLQPIFVESKRHYKQLCKQYGVTARCLM